LEQLVPAIGRCDHVIFSQGFVEANLARWVGVVASGDGAVDEPPAKRQKAAARGREDHEALRFLRALRARLAQGQEPPRACWVCPWGKDGAFALDAASGEGFFEPAQVQPRVVDSTGAGDTFIASYIHARLQEADTPAALRCGCAVAGRKVSQLGFNGLAAAVPEGLQ